MVLTRNLVVTVPEIDNGHVINTFEHCRYRYNVSEHYHVRPVLVLIHSLFLPAVVILYTYWMKLKFCLKHIFKDVPDEPEMHLELKWLLSRDLHY